MSLWRRSISGGSDGAETKEEETKEEEELIA